MGKNQGRRLKSDILADITDLDSSLTVDGGRLIHSALAEQGILIVDPENRIEFASKGLDKLIEVPKRLLKKNCLRQDLMRYRLERGDMGPGAVERVDKYISNFAPGVTGTIETKTPSGRSICVHGIPMPSGGSIITFFDITHVDEFTKEIEERGHELRRAKQENEALFENLQAVVENIKYGVVFLDPDMKADLINRACREMWGLEKEFCDSRPHMREIIEYNRYSSVYDIEDTDFEEYADSRIEAVKTGDAIKSEIVLNNGTILSYRCVVLPEGYRMLTYFDVTDIKNGEQEIRRHAETLEVVQNAIGHGLSWFDKDLRLRVWNKKCMELLELEDAGLKVGDSIEKVFRYNALRGEYGEGDPDVQVAERMELTREFVPHVFERTRADGRVLQIEGFPVADDGFVTVYTDVTEACRSREQIEYLAHHDALTGIANRVQFNECLEEAHAKVNDEGDRIAVISFDLDHFKDVNDTMGHDIGDQLLQAIVQRVKGVLRQDDVFARLGGDEFVIIRRGLERPNEAGKLAQKIVDLTSDRFEIDGHEIIVGASAGISISTPQRPGASPNQILRESDLALYNVKAKRRGTYCYFKEELNIQLLERKSLERDLSRAVSREEFRVFYQPQVDARTQKIVGAEALVRWEHPERGLVGPQEFIAIAEETGLIRQIGQFVLETACSDFASLKNLRLSVNLSPVQFRLNDISKMVLDTLVATEFDASRLELEITENVLLQENGETRDSLGRLKSLGVSIALDDFGTGYSSLSYLRQFPFDKLKIDRNFISDMGHDGESNPIVQAVINLGKGLGMRVNAEGVETHLQADMLRIEGCDELQGYFFGRPMPFEELKLFINGKTALKSDSNEDGDKTRIVSSSQKIVRTA